MQRSAKGRAAIFALRFSILVPGSVVYVLTQGIILNELLIDSYIPFGRIIEPHASISQGIFLVGAILLSVTWLFPHLVRANALRHCLNAISISLVISATIFAIENPYRIFWDTGWFGSREYYFTLNPVLKEIGSITLIVVLLRLIGLKAFKIRDCFAVLAPGLGVSVAIAVPMLMGYPEYLG